MLALTHHMFSMGKPSAGTPIGGCIGQVLGCLTHTAPEFTHSYPLWSHRGMFSRYVLLID